MRSFICRFDNIRNKLQQTISSIGEKVIVFCFFWRILYFVWFSYNCQVKRKKSHLVRANSSDDNQLDLRAKKTRGTISRRGRACTSDRHYITIGFDSVWSKERSTIVLKGCGKYHEFSWTRSVKSSANNLRNDIISDHVKDPNQTEIQNYAGSHTFVSETISSKRTYSRFSIKHCS